MKPTFFRSQAAFRAWLTTHHATTTELLVGYYKKGCGKPSMTWPESVDEALCFGWIDSIRRSIDEHSYSIRFTPRRQTSAWSAINIERVRVLCAQGRMKEAGLKAFSRRSEAKSGVYSYEQAETAALEREEESRFRRNQSAWKFFEAQPPRYRHLAIWHIVSAMKPETRRARLARLIEASGNRQRL